MCTIFHFYSMLSWKEAQMKKTELIGDELKMTFKPSMEAQSSVGVTAHTVQPSIKPLLLLPLIHLHSQVT